MFVGGLLLVSFWFGFTAVHGPTSVDQGGDASAFWSRLLGAAQLPILGALTALHPRDPLRTARVAWAGYIVMFGGVLLWALVDLAYFVPVGIPVAGTGSILLAWGLHPRQGRCGRERWLLFAFGVLCVVGTLSYFALPLEQSDRYSGFRFFGIATYAVPGVIWMVLSSAVYRTDS